MRSKLMRNEDKNPALGLLIMLITSVLFWGTCGLAVVNTIDHVTTGRAYRQVCERLVADGWRDVTLPECVALFRAAPE